MPRPGEKPEENKRKKGDEILAPDPDAELLNQGPEDNPGALLEPVHKQARIMRTAAECPMGMGVRALSGGSDPAETGAGAAKGLRVNVATKHLDK